MKKCTIFCSVFIFFTGTSAETDWEVAMVVDAVRSLGTPSSVIATLCWPAYKKIKLQSALNNGGNYVGIEYTKSGQNIELKIPEQHLLFALDLACNNLTENIEMHNAKNHFRSPFRWLLLDRFSNDEESQLLVPTAVENLNLLPDAEVMVARLVSNNSYDFHYIYKISCNDTWRTEFYGSWNPENRFQKNKQLRDTAALRRSNMEGLVIPICFVVLNNDSLIHLTDNINPHLDSITKVNIPTSKHLLEFLNATPKYVFENSWGFNVNGTFGGLTGHLLRNTCYLGGTPMFITPERWPVVEYISSPTPTQLKFVFQQPKLSYTSNLFLLSLKTSVWYSLMVLVFLMFLALVAVATWEWRRDKNLIDGNTNTGILRGNVQDIFLMVIGAACQQGSPVELKGSLGRVVMLILFLALMFLYTSFSANIVALFNSSSSQIKTLDDLLHSRLKLGVHDYVYTRRYYADALDPVRKKLYQTKIAPPGTKLHFIASMEEGVKNIQKGLYAFHMELGIGYKLVNKFFLEGEKCSLDEIDFFNFRSSPWLTVARYTPYKEMFKIGLKRIHEHGLQKRENARIYEKRPMCSGRKSQFISVSMVDCYPALLVLAYGMISALLFLVMEILVKKRQKFSDKVWRRVN